MRCPCSMRSASPRPATSLPAGSAARTTDAAADTARSPLMTHADMLAWRDHGHEIGSHTLDHVALSHVPAHVSEAGSDRRIEAAARSVERPDGRIVLLPVRRSGPARVRDQAAAAGYRNATTTPARLRRYARRSVPVAADHGRGRRRCDAAVVRVRRRGFSGAGSPRYFGRCLRNASRPVSAIPINRNHPGVSVVQPAATLPMKLPSIPPIAHEIARRRTVRPRTSYVPFVHALTAGKPCASARQPRRTPDGLSASRRPYECTHGSSGQHDVIDRHDQRLRSRNGSRWPMNASGASSMMKWPQSGTTAPLQIRRVVTHRDQRCIAGRMFGTNGEHRHCQLALRPCLISAGSSPESRGNRRSRRASFTRR